jgi:hypothetical protein
VRLLLLLVLAGCNLDTDREAPYLAPPNEPGECGTTATLFPRLLAFLEEGRFEPLKQVLLSRLAPSEAEPLPDPSLRVVFNAIVRLVTQLGLAKTQDIAAIAARAELEQELSPLIVLLLEFVDGRLDGRDHYEAIEAGGYFVRVCDPDHLLTAVELLLRLESPSFDEPWLVAVLDALRPMLANPQIQPFLESFERNSETGRPAILSILVQIFAFIADENFAISRVETLLESAVYPAVDRELEDQIKVLVRLLDEATAAEAGVFEPLQEAVRCGMQHPEQRDALIGMAYDLVATEQVGLSSLLDSASGVLASEGLIAELSLFADTVRLVRTDLTIRDDLRALIVVLLSRPDVTMVVPVMIDLIEQKVLTELLQSLVVLLDGCGRA